jgi:hypothetical protein
MTRRLVVEGDSNPAGYNMGAGNDLATQLAAKSFFAGCTFANVAVSGSTLTNVDPSAGITERYAANVYPLRPIAGEEVYLVFVIGTNDANNATGGWVASWEAAFASYVATAKADGFKVCICTITPYNLNATTIANIAAWNTYIRAFSGADFIFDHYAVIPDENDETLYQSAGVHWTALATSMLAAWDNSVLVDAAANKRVEFDGGVEMSGGVEA